MADYLHVMQHAATGATCSVVKRESDWLFTLADTLTLSVECPWRVITDKGIAVTDEDDGQLFGLNEPVRSAARTNALLIGKRLVAFDVDIRTADLRLSFEGGIQLQVFNNSSGYEGWQASFRYGEVTLTARSVWAAAISISATDRIGQFRLRWRQCYERRSRPIAARSGYFDALEVPRTPESLLG